jgi:Ras-related protein Rab-2A
MQSNLYSLKYIIIGDSNIGKSSILYRYINCSYNTATIPTIGIDYGIKLITVHDNVCKLKICDTAGQESFRSIIRTYYRDSIGILLCFDLTNQKSFNILSEWIIDVIANSSTYIKPTFILVGTKSDDIENRKIEHSDAVKFATTHNMNYIEVSAKTNYNIDEVFYILTTTILIKLPLIKFDYDTYRYSDIGFSIEASNTAYNYQATKCCVLQ